MLSIMVSGVKKLNINNMYAGQIFTILKWYLGFISLDVLVFCYSCVYCFGVCVIFFFNRVLGLVV